MRKDWRFLVRFWVIALFAVYMVAMPLSTWAMTVKLSVIGDPARGMILEETGVTVKDGATAFDVLMKKMGDKVKYRAVGKGFWIEEIDGLKEGVFGDWSGWTYYVNDKMPLKLSSDYPVQEGDRVAFKYSTSGM